MSKLDAALFNAWKSVGSFLSRTTGMSNFRIGRIIALLGLAFIAAGDAVSRGHRPALLVTLFLTLFFYLVIVRRVLKSIRKLEQFSRLEPTVGFASQQAKDALWLSCIAVVLLMLNPLWTFAFVLLGGSLYIARQDGPRVLNTFKRKKT